jgi:hypothetical protein
MFKFACSSCGKPVKARDDWLGKETMCLNCGAKVTVPQPSAFVLLEKPAPPRSRPWGLWVGGLLIALVLGIAIGLAVFGRRSGSQPAASESLAISPEQGASYPDTAEGVLRHYLLTDSVEKRLAYVRNPEKVAPLMTRFYESVGGVQPTPDPVFGTHYDVPASWAAPLPYSVMAVKFPGDAPEGWYFLAKTAQGYKVDWEALRNTEPTLKRYAVEAPPGPVKVRVNCEIDNYYNYSFADSKPTHYSLRLIDREGYRIHGFLAKASPGAVELADALLKVKQMSVLLELQLVGPGGQPLPPRESEHVSVNRIVSFSWIEW